MISSSKNRKSDHRLESEHSSSSPSSTHNTTNVERGKRRRRSCVPPKDVNLVTNTIDDTSNGAQGKASSIAKEALQSITRSLFTLPQKRDEVNDTADKDVDHDATTLKIEEGHDNDDNCGDCNDCLPPQCSGTKYQEGNNDVSIQQKNSTARNESQKVAMGIRSESKAAIVATSHDSVPTENCADTVSSVKVYSASNASEWFSMLSKQFDASIFDDECFEGPSPKKVALDCSHSCNYLNKNRDSTTVCRIDTAITVNQGTISVDSERSDFKRSSTLLPNRNAPNIKDFFEPGGTVRFLPNPVWFFPPTPSFIDDDYVENAVSTRSELLVKTDAETTQVPPTAPSSFGADWDPAIIFAIREHATEAALYFIQHSTYDIVVVTNAKGVTPIIMAAQKGNVTIVKELLRRGADPSHSSLNGNTPLLQASHFGHTAVAEVLLSSCYEYLPINGRTRDLHDSSQQVRFLLDQANTNLTTPLMRASQEGHIDVVRVLLRHYLESLSMTSTTMSSFLSKRAVAAYVNRRNAVHMTAFMLASQRGHANICKILIEYGDDDVLDARTQSDATSLMLACKRGHIDVVKVLVTGGCELYRKDSRGRTAREVVASRVGRNNDNRNDTRDTMTTSSSTTSKQKLSYMLELLDPTVQIDLMQRAALQSRNFDVVKMWCLLQRERAFVPIDDMYSTSIHKIEDVFQGRHPSVQQYGLPYYLRTQSKQALVRTMTLPLPLVQNIIQYLPPPLIWSKRITMLTNRSVINPTATVSGALDLIDEILEEAGFLEACHASGSIPTPPAPRFVSSWIDWKRWCQDCHLEQQRRQSDLAIVSDTSTTISAGNAISADPSSNRLRILMDRERPNATYAQMPTFQEDREKPYMLVELRRMAQYLQVLKEFSITLQPILSSPPYNIPPIYIQQLIITHDLASLVRRMGSSRVSAISNDSYGGIQFDASFAMDVVFLASRFCSWYWREREVSANAPFINSR